MATTLGSFLLDHSNTPGLELLLGFSVEGKVLTGHVCLSVFFGFFVLNFFFFFFFFLVGQPTQLAES